MESEYIAIKDFDALVAEAEEQCRNKEVFNLLLKYQFPIELVESPFIEQNKTEAEKWISKTVSLLTDSIIMMERGRILLLMN